MSSAATISRAGAGQRSDRLERERLLRLDDARSRARRGLLNFTAYTKPDFEISWHHRLMCRYLNQLADGTITRLLITAPPRHTKSELMSRRLPAYLLGRNPDLEVISASYNAKLAQRMNRDVQRIVTSRQYKELFPDTRLNERNIRTVADGSWLRNSEMFEVVGRKGYYLCSGIGGGLTGSGGDVALIDDPVKDWQEAFSETHRENVWEWYSSVLYTRLSKFGRIGLTLTRWHEDDLAGRLLEKMKSDPEADQWTVVNLPAIKEGVDRECDEDPRAPGEALWSDRFPVERLNKAKRVNAMVWMSLYQQRPAPPDGNIVKTKWWQFYKVRPPLTWFDEVIISVDLPFKKKKTSKKSQMSDYAVFQLWGKKGSQFYLLDQVRDRMGYTQQEDEFLALCARYPEAIGKLIEAAANGEALMDRLEKKVSGLIPITPRGDKTVRAQASAPLMKARNVFLPHESIAPWVAEYLVEWAVFPAGKNDDQVDATTQALLYWNGPGVNLADCMPIGIGKASQWSQDAGSAVPVHGSPYEETPPWLTD